MIYYYNPKMPKQHWLKEFMELKLGNLPAQAFTDKFNKACDKPGNKFNSLHGEEYFLKFSFFISTFRIYYLSVPSNWQL
jgi:hypothetical protein